MSFLDGVNELTLDSQLLDITNVPPNNKTYGGLACQKVGVTIDGVDYLIKYPGRLKGRNLTNVTMSYSNSSIGEFLGSEIFKVFGFSTHSVNIVKRNGKICAMCRDFTDAGRLIEFRELISTYESAFIDADGDETDGSQTDLDNIIEVIRNHHILKNLPYEEFFWKMFIVDFLIGNHDRNTGNFGVLEKDGKFSIAPIYDNGNSLNPTWDEEKMKRFSNDSDIEQIAYKAYTCRFVRNGKHVNPYQLIKSKEFNILTSALESLVKTPIGEILASVVECPYISNVQKSFYFKVISCRYEKLKELSGGDNYENCQY